MNFSEPWIFSHKNGIFYYKKNTKWHIDNNPVYSCKGFKYFAENVLFAFWHKWNNLSFEMYCGVSIFVLTTSENFKMIVEYENSDQIYSEH